MGRKVKYRNNEERIYMALLPRIQNVVDYQEEILEVMEEKNVLAEEEKSKAHIADQVMAQRKLVLYARKLLAAVTSCEPEICREKR